MTRRLSRITSLALAIAAVAAPSASAIDKVSPDARDAGQPTATVDLRSPDARDAGRPAAAIDRVSPDARDDGRRETAPIVVPAPALARADHFDWLDAGLGAAGLAVVLLLAGSAVVVRTRRGTVGAA